MYEPDEPEKRKHPLGKPHVVAAQTIRALKDVTFRRNKYRPDAQLSSRNLEINASIAAGASGMVFRGRNKDTNIQYALKIFRRRYNKNPGSSPPEGDPSPTLTRSSGASIVSSKAMYPHSLGMKREREAKTYLHYIKAGHRYICNFEAWCEFDVRGDRRFLHVFELCDAGTLFDIVATYSEKKSFPPETFIWRVFEQLFDALAFLHGEHPLYKDKPEFQPPRTTVVLDIKEDNIFFKWPQERIEHYYPDLKLGDFGSCVHLPVGGQRESDLYNVVSEPPEYMISAKYDVWCGGSMIFYMAKLAERPNVELPFYMANTSRNRELLRQDPNRIKQQIDDHYTGWLEEDIKFTLTMDPNKRPTAWEVVEKIRSGAQKRRALPYIPLPDWVHLDSFMEHKFDPAIVASIEVEGESGDPRRAEINADARLRRQMPDRLGRINEEQVNWYEKSVHVNKNELQEADTAELFIERRPLRRTRKFRAYRPL